MVKNLGSTLVNMEEHLKNALDHCLLNKETIQITAKSTAHACLSAWINEFIHYSKKKGHVINPNNWSWL